MRKTFFAIAVSALALPLSAAQEPRLLKVEDIHSLKLVQDPQISPDGQWVKITEYEGGVSDLSWSPDGKRLALVVYDPEPAAADPAEDDRSIVYVAETRRLRVKSADGTEVDAFLTLPPDRAGNQRVPAVLRRPAGGGR